MIFKIRIQGWSLSSFLFMHIPHFPHYSSAKPVPEEPSRIEALNMDGNRTLWLHTKSVCVLLGLIPICLPFLFSIPPFPSWCLINGINYLQLAAWSWQPFTSRVPFVSRSSVTRYAPCGAVAGLMKGNQAGLSPFFFSLSLS